MVSNPSNRSGQLVSHWIDKIWYVEQVNGNGFGVSTPDPVTFANVGTGTTVQILSALPQNVTSQTASNPNSPWPWGTLNQSSVATAMSSTNPSILVTGQTTWGQPFHIEYPYNGDPKRLACFIDSPRHAIPWNGVALGTISGTVLGVAVGFVFGAPVLGATAGLVAATAGAVAVVADVIHVFATQGGGSTPTWVANDGPVGRPGQPGPHLVDGTTA